MPLKRRAESNLVTFSRSFCSLYLGFFPRCRPLCEGSGAGCRGKGIEGWSEVHVRETSCVSPGFLELPPLTPFMSERCEPRLKWSKDPGAASRMAFRSSLARGEALGTMSPPVEQGPRGDGPYPWGGSLSRALLWGLRLVPCSGCPWMELLISFSF